LFQNDEFNHSFSHDYFIKPISYSLKTDIQIYDIRKSDIGTNLRKEIQYDPNKNFICIVKISNKHYVTLFIESKNKYDLRYIHILNSILEEVNIKIFEWFTGVIDKCIYKLHFISCPKQRIMSNDSLLHAYFNASACQWALKNNHWNFLKKNFSRQEFSTKENIEKLKQWFIETNEKPLILNDIDNNIQINEKIEIIEKFKSLLTEIIQSSLVSLEFEQIKNHVEYLSNLFITINSYDEIILINNLI
ncbi:unnamed protein product, partial [Rotaria sordida]